jgi:hypothetical protein
MMSCGEYSGPIQGDAMKVEVGQLDLIAGCFAFNHSPDDLLRLTLRKDAIVISGPIPTNLPHQTIFPVTADLSYRIISSERVFIYLVRPVHKIFFGCCDYETARQN